MAIHSLYDPANYGRCSVCFLCPSVSYPPVYDGASAIAIVTIIPPAPPLPGFASTIVMMDVVTITIAITTELMMIEGGAVAPSRNHSHSGHHGSFYGGETVTTSPLNRLWQ